MRALPEILAEMMHISSNPKSQLDCYLKQNRKVIGCMPYYCPEKLVHAAGMVPFGLWGAQTRISEARRYLPVFICSIIQTTLELGIMGKYEGISAVMIPILCDSLKSMDGNWRYGIRDIPVIPVAHAQNRKTEAGAEFTVSQYRKVKTSLEEISGRKISDSDIKASISVYNKRNATLRRFIDELARRPETIKPSERNAVFKSGWFMDAGEYTEKVNELCECLAALPVTDDSGLRLVTCGILADNTGLLRILDECGASIVDDAVMHESLRYRADSPEADDPLMSLALQIGVAEGCPVLYDPGKKRGALLVELARQRSASGVLFITTKFCDPEEFDIVPLKKILNKNGIKNLQVEVDQQTTDLEQIRTAVETFIEILR